MSYNIDSVRILNGGLRITAANLMALRLVLAGQLPDSNFLDVQKNVAIQRMMEKDDTLIDIAPSGFLHWCGDGSGHAFDVFCDEVVPKLLGEADLLVIWEGGDSVEGYRVKSGECRQCDVDYTLKERS